MVLQEGSTMRKYLTLSLIVSVSVITIIVIFPASTIRGETKKAVKISKSQIEASKLSAATSRVGQVFERVSLDQGVKLSPEAKEILIKEIIVDGKYKGIPPDRMGISESEAKKLTGAIASKAEKGEVTANSINSFIIEDKIKRVNATIPENISKYATDFNVRLIKGTEGIIQKDLEMQTKAMAESSLSVSEIKDRNVGYLKAIYSATSSQILDPAEYGKLRYSIFPSLIKVTIHSIPSGSNVETGGVAIGETSIVEKSFEPEKKYIFIFKQSGYKTSEREYFVTLHPPKQELTEVLIEEKME
jgi:hypothetical protein